MHEGENLTYIPISRSWPIKIDRHKETYQRKCLQSSVYNTKNTNKEVNKSNIETSDKKCVKIYRTWKQ